MVICMDKKAKNILFLKRIGQVRDGKMINPQSLVISHMQKKRD